MLTPQGYGRAGSIVIDHDTVIGYREDIEGSANKILSKSSQMQREGDCMNRVQRTVLIWTATAGVTDYYNIHVHDFDPAVHSTAPEGRWYG